MGDLLSPAPGLEPVPVLVLTTEVRGHTFRSFCPIHVAVDDVTWRLLAGAALLLYDKARDDHRGRGLPGPTVRQCSWRGGVVIPELASTT